MKSIKVAKLSFTWPDERLSSLILAYTGASFLSFSRYCFLSSAISSVFILIVGILAGSIVISFYYRGPQKHFLHLHRSLRGSLEWKERAPLEIRNQAPLISR